MELYIQTGVTKTLSEQIPGSVEGETVNIELRRDSDGHWWNFVSQAFQESTPAPMNAMTFDRAETWTADFKPNASGDYSLWIYYGGSKVFHKLMASGAPAPASVAGSYLITLADVKGCIEVTGNDDDSVIEGIIPRVQKEAEAHCNRLFGREAGRVEYKDGDGGNIIMLERYPVESIASIHDDTDRVFGADALVESDDYLLYPESGKVELDYLVTTPGRRSVKIVYTGGYGGTYAVPEDLKNALIKLTVADYIEWRAGVASTRDENGNSKSYELRRQAKAILDTYRRMVL